LNCGGHCEWVAFEMGAGFVLAHLKEFPVVQLHVGKIGSGPPLKLTVFSVEFPEEDWVAD
jgi:hypothetical protein